MVKQQVGPSLYCFALVMPSGVELELAKALLQRGAGPFACAGRELFSNASVNLGLDAAAGGEVVTVPIGGSLECAYGGRWGTALNTDIFIRVWNAVSTSGKYQYYDWTVKLDADCVFLPQRLMTMISGVPSTSPAYLNNCKWGMHGPIEVINRPGMQTFLAGQAQCSDIRDDAMQPQPVYWHPLLKRYAGDDKEHSFGEDQYARRCLARLGVQKLDEVSLLTEKACGAEAYPCNSGAVAFHPFKQADAYFECVQLANAA